MLRQGCGEIMRLAFLAGALVSFGLNLIEQYIAAPTQLRACTQVIKTLGWILYLVEDHQMMAPRSLDDRLTQQISWSGLLSGSHFISDFGYSLRPKSGSDRSLRQFGYSLWPNCQVAVSSEK